MGAINIIIILNAYFPQAIETCEFGYENKAKDVCINPYHYRRIDSAPILPPVLVPRFPMNNGQSSWKPIPEPTLPYNQTINVTPRSNYRFNSLSPAGGIGENMSVMGHGQQIGLQPHSPHGRPPTPGQNVLSPKTGSVTSPTSCMSSPGAQSADYSSYGSPGHFATPQTYTNDQGTSCVYSTASHTSYPNSPNYVQPPSPYPTAVDQKPHNGVEYSEVRMEQPSVWANFTYYELNTRVGDPFTLVPFSSS